MQNVPEEEEVKKENENSEGKEKVASEEKKEAVAATKREKLKLPEDMKDETTSKAKKIPSKSFESKDEQQYINSSQPIRITPDTIVKSDRVILKPEEPQEIRPFEVNSEEYEPKFEEIYVDDLDEYIK